MDNSRTISGKEAFLLGFVLALDVFGAGIGAVLLDYSIILTSLSFPFMSGLLLIIGIYTGFTLSNRKGIQQMGFLPPCILIILGILNLL
ncbi:manganese efflux pump [Halalkalibacter kiskunsagensis]|uniref:Manganese efflux pump n=1 Tax=Halalkalibacter kiskunsagensis TaxID=1548599 RepID=A0ABV6KH53_9BACI